MRKARLATAPLCILLHNSPNIHGAVVDELTDGQVRQVLVPLPETDEDVTLMHSVDVAMKEGTELKSRAVAYTEAGIGELESRFSERHNTSSKQSSHKANYKGATPQQVAKAVENYLPKPKR